MPSLYAHYLFGQDALGQLDPEARAIAQAHANLYALGLQGPDIFFYGSIIGPKSIGLFGHNLHYRSLNGILEEITTDLGAKSGRIWGALPYPEVAYLMGFIGHFVLDSLCHPYVFKVQRNMVNHFALEADWDQFLLAQKTETPWKISMAPFVETEKEDRLILTNVYRAYQKKISPAKVRYSARSIYRIHKHLAFPNRLKYRFLAWIMERLKINPDYLAMFILPPEKGERIHLNWPERPKDSIEILQGLYQDALSLYPKLISNFRDRLETGVEYMEFADRNFEGHEKATHLHKTSTGVTKKESET